MGASKGMHSFDTALYCTVLLKDGTTGALIEPVPSALSTITDAWSEIGQVISISGVPMERTVTEITHLRSPNKAKEKVPRFLDGGQQTFKMNYSKLAMGTLLSIMPGANAAPNGTIVGNATLSSPTVADPTVYAPETPPIWGRMRFAVVFPDHGVWVFTGFVKSLPIDVPEDNQNTIDATIEISGKPTFYSFA